MSDETTHWLLTWTKALAEASTIKEELDEWIDDYSLVLRSQLLPITSIIYGFARNSSPSFTYSKNSSILQWAQELSYLAVAVFSTILDNGLQNSYNLSHSFCLDILKALTRWRKRFYLWRYRPERGYLLVTARPCTLVLVQNGPWNWLMILVQCWRFNGCAEATREENNILVW